MDDMENTASSGQ